jgi:hypothetical protein
MELARQQQVLAQLYTNAELRRRFFTHPEATGQSLGLSLSAAQQLAQISVSQVRYFARSLQRKRLKEVAKILPATHRLLSSQFDELFLKYSQQPFPRRVNKLAEDARAFVEFLDASLRVTQPWMADLARYEAAWLTASTQCLVARWFRFPAHKLRELSAPLESPPECQPTLALWFRSPLSGRLRHLILCLPRFRR